MSSDIYISNIVKKLKCSKSKRDDIKKQLQSDIQIAMENGETIEAIVSRMGTPDNVAKEFNDNLPETELIEAKRRNSVKVISVAGIVLIVMVIVVYYNLPKANEDSNSESLNKGNVQSQTENVNEGTFDQETVKKQSELIVDLLNKKDYDALVRYGDEVMKPTLTKDNLETAKGQISSDWGEFKSFENVYITEATQMGKKYAVVQMIVAYDNVSITYTISFDKDMKLAGLYMK